MGGRLNGNAVSYVPQVYHQSTQMPLLSRDFSYQQVFGLFSFLLRYTFCKMIQINFNKVSAAEKNLWFGERNE